MKETSTRNNLDLLYTEMRGFSAVLSVIGNGAAEGERLTDVAAGEAFFALSQWADRIAEDISANNEMILEEKKRLKAV